MLTVDDIRRRINESNNDDHRGYECSRVLKHGRTTGWTAGSLNQLDSNCRRGRESDQPFVTRELCVVNVISNDAKLKSFSDPGDSGSCVIDLDGRVIGMLHGGNLQAANHRVEITYVTPMEWVLKGIEEDLNLGPDEIVF